MSTVVIAGEPGTAEHLTALLASGDAAAVAAFFQGMSEKERRTFVKPLRAQLKTLSWRVYRDSGQSQDWSRFRDLQRRSARTQIPAAMAVLANAPAIAKYLRTVQRQNGLDIAPDAIRRVLADRAPEWLPELADELSAVLDANDLLPLVDIVADAAGAVPAATPGYVRAWAVRHRWGHSRDQERETFLAEPRLAELLPLTFDDDENDDLFAEWSSFRKFAQAAVEQGKAPRAEVLDACVRRLLRGGRLGAVQGHLGFWTSLAPTDDEIVARVSSCISLLSSQSGTVARVFLGSVKKVCDAGLVDLELALEAASVAVTRPEKNVVKTTLGWLDALAAEHPDRIVEITGHLATAFGAPGADLQERAVKLIGKRAEALGEGDRRRLAAEAEVHLAPDLAAKLADVLGVERGSATFDVGYPDVTPFEPRPLPPPIGSPAELAEEVAALMHGDPVEAMVFERVLEAFAAFARTDADKLAEAVAPVVERQRPGWEWNLENFPHTPRVALFRLAEAAAGSGTQAKRKPHRASVHQLWPRVRMQRTGYASVRSRTSPADFLILRAAEIAAALGLTDLPPLVAIPTAANGIVDPRVLADRLREGESEGWVPLEADFHQALLRLPADCGEVDASGLTSDAGRRFAAWVAGDRTELPAEEMPDPLLRDRVRYGQGRSTLLNQLARKHVSHPATLLELAAGVWSEPERQYDGSDWAVCWPAIAPSHPDLVAVALSGGADWSTAEPSAESAVVLAELDDPVHAGTHYLIASRLVHRDARLRASGVDAALVLASRGLLDPARLAATLAERLASEPAAGLRRMVPCLRDLANGGAAGQTWETIATLLPLILPPAVPKAMAGTGDLLVAGTELAGALNVRTPIDAVTTVAEKKGGSAVANAARRLAGVLGSG
ncbi:DUF6493 family protein [Catenulispora subtropica]|uniref:Secreted protein n=1 Tax=Catenulispora subtropica TaxID=450798 RepID=A0ABP5E666_9ACTN